MTQMLKEINQQPEVLKRSMQSNENTVKSLVESIRQRDIKSVYIAARGTSDHAAVYGKYVIEILTGIPVGLAAPSVFTLYNKKVHLKNSLVIGISQSGKAADVLEVVKSANSTGAITASITNDPLSPLARKAQFHLDCNAGPELSVAATKTFTAQMLLMAQLASEWSEDDETRKKLPLVPEKVLYTLDKIEDIKKAVKKYVSMNECFILARGVNYAAALECALKIQETTYIRAKAFASSDFYHGPLALVDKNIPVIIFAPTGPSLQDSITLINRLKEDNVEIIAVSNSEEVLASAACGLSIPYTDNDIISPFPNVVVAQIFACEMALAKGLNPDKPRRLSKVTITK